MENALEKICKNCIHSRKSINMNKYTTYGKYNRNHGYTANSGVDREGYAVMTELSGNDTERCPMV